MSLTVVNSVTRDPVALDYNAATAQFNAIRADCLEMAQLKSNFDIEQFTLNSQGPFIAHQFHFLMRQYSLALLELRRLYNDYDRLEKKHEWLSAPGENDDPANGVFINNEVVECELQMDQLLLSIVNKQQMCSRFELCRKKLIEQNGKPFTNVQYQAEEPAYWEHTFKRMIEHYRLQAKSGVPEGVWKNLEAAAGTPLLDGQNQLLLCAPVPEKQLPAPKQNDLMEMW